MTLLANMHTLNLIHTHDSKQDVGKTTGAAARVTLTKLGES